MKDEEDKMWIHRYPKIMKELGQPVITIRHLSKSYTIPGTTEAVTALHDIHLAPDSEFFPIRRGEFVILRGPSGGGKTSLLNILGTIDSGTSGTLEILGEKITDISSDKYLSHLRLRRIGFVFQTFNLLATMSAYENVELPMTIRGKLSKKQIKERALMLLQSNDPDILLLDEPTGDLDTVNTIEIMNLLLKINHEKKTTCVMVTHNPDVECYADRLLYLQDGRFVKQAINRVGIRQAERASKLRLIDDMEQIQTPLVLEDYQEYLKRKDEDMTIS
ncbi:ABC transporter H member 2 [Borealophlyctis nickersoniae]|nr:ABC transporter H member 2 [Borealophlyctis nickersoniae]